MFRTNSIRMAQNLYLGQIMIYYDSSKITQKKQINEVFYPPIRLYDQQGRR